MNEFFLMPINCGKILYSKSNIEPRHYTNSLWNRFFKPKLYNFFICTKGVALFEKKSNSIKETIIFYNDKDFLKKLPKKPYEFYVKSVEKFVDYAKKELKKGKKIYLYFENYKFEISKNSFLVYKNDKLTVNNFLSEIIYDELEKIVINPYTNKKIKFFAPKKVYEFFQFYKENSHLKNCDKNIKRTNILLLLFYDILVLIIFLAVSILGTIFFWYIDYSISNQIDAFRQVMEGVIAIAMAEFIIAVFKSKIYY